MALVEKALHAILSANAGVTALVSNRIYPRFAPAKTATPYITYDDVSDVPLHHLGGALGYNTRRFQINMISDNYGETVAMREAVRSALDGYQGAISGVTIHFITRNGASGGDLPEDDGTEPVLYGKRQDFFIQYAE